MFSLFKMLPAMLRMAGDNPEVCEQAVFAAWRVVAGAQLTRTCVPFRLNRKYLIIAVPDETWKRQMEAMSGELIFKLDSLLGSPMVIFIEFRVDPAHVAQANAPKERPIEFQHTQELKEELQAAAAAIKDDALREQFLRTAAKSLERLEKETAEHYEMCQKPDREGGLNTPANPPSRSGF